MDQFGKPIQVQVPSERFEPHWEIYREAKGVIAGEDWRAWRPFEAPTQLGVDNLTPNIDPYVHRALNRGPNYADSGRDKHHALLRLREAQDAGNAEASRYWSHILANW